MLTNETPVLESLTRLDGISAVWEILYPTVRRMIRQVLRLRPEDALSDDEKDLLAEATYRALTAVCRYRSGFRGGTEGEARAWLRSVCRTAAWRQAKQGRACRVRLVATDPERVEALAEGRNARSAPDAMTAREAKEILSEAVPNAAWREMWLLWNRPGEALDYEEIASRTGRTAASVAVTLSRVRKAIRRACLDGGV